MTYIPSTTGQVRGGYTPYGTDVGRGSYTPYGTDVGRGGYRPYGADAGRGGYRPYGADVGRGGYRPYGTDAGRSGYRPYGTDAGQGFYIPHGNDVAGSFTGWSSVARIFGYNGGYSGGGFGGFNHNPIAGFIGGLFGGNRYGYGGNRYGYGGNNFVDREFVEDEYGNVRERGVRRDPYQGRYQHNRRHAPPEGEYDILPDGRLRPVDPTQHYGYPQQERYNQRPGNIPSSVPQYRPFARNTDANIQSLTDRLQDVVAAGNDPAKLAEAAAAYAEAAQAFGGPKGHLPVPPQGIIVPAHDGYKGFEVWGADRIRNSKTGETHNSPEFLAQFVLKNNPTAAAAVGHAFAAQSNAPTQGNGQPLDIRPHSNLNPPQPQPQLSGAVDLQKLEEQLDAKYPEQKVGAIKALQAKLAMNGFGKTQGFSPVDGEIGPLTTAGFAQFAQSKGLDPMNVEQVLGALNQQARGAGITGGQVYAGEPTAGVNQFANAGIVIDPVRSNS